MLNRFRFFKRLVRDLPQQFRLAYCLFRDPRVPIPTKAAVAAVMGVIVTPFIDIPEVLPLVGELDVLALTLLALKLFVVMCPPEVVAEQEQLIIEQRSRFDEDLRNGERLISAIWRRFHSEHEDVAEAHWSADGGEAEVTSARQRGVVA
jgi:uncharacterized membrane protein YkvA (DUF1232 family)